MTKGRWEKPLWKRGVWDIGRTKSNGEGLIREKKDGVFGVETKSTMVGYDGRLLVLLVLSVADWRPNKGTE